LANKQRNNQNLSSNINKVFIIYDRNDEASFNELVQSLHDLHLTNLALYWEYDEEEWWKIVEEPWPGSQQRYLSTTFETAQIIILLVSRNSHAFADYYKIYTQRTWERYRLEEI